MPVRVGSETHQILAVGDVLPLDSGGLIRGSATFFFPSLLVIPDRRAGLKSRGQGEILES